jgi:integrase
MRGPSKRGHGDGGIDARGENTWRLRYRINGRRYTKTVEGTKAQAQKALRDLLHTGDTGAHVEPDKITVGGWVEQWIAIGCPGRKKKKAGRRSVERYSQLLRYHVLPVLGSRRLQQLQAVEIDRLYAALAEREVGPQTQVMVHIVFGACLSAAKRKRLLISNPMEYVEQVPSAGESDHGMVLDADGLRRLLDGFRGTVLFPIVATAAFTGARRNEILALRWSDLDPVNKTLRIERAFEGETGVIKGPKTERGKRTIVIDGDLVALLLAEREKYRRLLAGVSDSADVDLSLIVLPEDALMFPSPLGGSADLTRPRSPRGITKGFAHRARKLGFDGLRFHDLRGSHETALLDAGEPVHVVAARCGHDPSTLLKSYAKWTKKADDRAAATIGKIFKGIL